MAKPGFLSRVKRGPQQPQPTAAPNAPDTQAVPAAEEQQERPPTPGHLRRERRALVRAREERIRDLGGLLLEMYKRDQFRQDLYLEQSAEIVSMEDRIREIDEMVAAATRRTLSEANRCTCGAPLVWGAHFCANCGRPVGEAPVVACAHCGAPLPAESSFCASCGRPAEPAEPQPAQQAETAPPPAEPAAHEATIETSAGPPDPWER